MRIATYSAEMHRAIKFPENVTVDMIFHLRAEGIAGREDTPVAADTKSLLP